MKLHSSQRFQMSQTNSPDSLFVELSSRLLLNGLPDDFLRLTTVAQRQSSSQIEFNEDSPPLVLEASRTYVGQLRISFVQARLNKNYGLMRMNPYVRCRIGQNVFETPSATGGGRNPHWDKSVNCFLQRGVSQIFIDVLDEGMFTDSQIANVSINIPDAVLLGETVDNWYRLSGRMGENNEGEINVIISMIPLTSASGRVASFQWISKVERSYRIGRKKLLRCRTKTLKNLEHYVLLKFLWN
ncbi:hypothetical protein ACOME3_009903 [Neoechinorhynchus agilis]